MEFEDESNAAGTVMCFGTRRWRMYGSAEMFGIRYREILYISETGNRMAEKGMAGW